MRRVYLAGPDLFHPGYLELVERLTALCDKLSLVPLAPGDAPQKTAEEIVAANLDMIRGADIVVANLNPFRGAEPDSGKVFECGFAHGLGKPVLGYLSDHRDELAKARDRSDRPPPVSNIDGEGVVVEDFGQPLNIMLSLTVHKLYFTVEEALEAAAAL